jgi:hypothetical protein
VDESAVSVMYGSMSERALQDVVLQAAAVSRWLVYHTHDSRRSQPGFPDLVLAKGGRLLFRELKTQKGTLTKEQQRWIDALRAAGADAGVWRPRDWGRGAIIAELGGIP